MLSPDLVTRLCTPPQSAEDIRAVLRHLQPLQLAEAVQDSASSGQQGHTPGGAIRLEPDPVESGLRIANFIWRAVNGPRVSRHGN